ncbi:hypothetical protein CVT24_005219 [Panaeolus cyanescens]|uniref:Uncharacterized protein n=1 Tax=Panaeolus cyanescens TaxID=181874 RepID=A0A409Y9S3_9AGAR|nr:hypothetical protein CVT24_005219 [Panaeolus cyanescens]
MHFSISVLLNLTTLLWLSSNAWAINQYITIGNAPKPATCGNSGILPSGGWIANKRCGYVMGTAVAGQRFDVVSTDSSGYHYGRYRGTGGNFCTFLIPSSLNLATKVEGIAASCSTTTSATLCDRRAFGRDFDAAPHTGNGAVIVPLNLSACPGFYNYFVDSNFVSGAFQDPVPFNMATTSGAGYRYSTRDGVASMHYFTAFSKSNIYHTSLSRGMSQDAELALKAERKRLIDMGAVTSDRFDDYYKVWGYKMSGSSSWDNVLTHFNVKRLNSECSNMGEYCNDYPSSY